MIRLKVHSFKFFIIYGQQWIAIKKQQWKKSSTSAIFTWINRIDNVMKRSNQNEDEANKFVWTDSILLPIAIAVYNTLIYGNTLTITSIPRIKSELLFFSISFKNCWWNCWTLYLFVIKIRQHGDEIKNSINTIRIYSITTLHYWVGR